MKTGIVNWRDAVLMAVLAALGSGAAAMSFAHVGVDDAYISYRYAENLAHGDGAVYNPGERVYGSTTLAWMGLLALGSVLTGASVEIVARWLVMVLLPLSDVLLYLLMRRIGANRLTAAVTGMLLLTAPYYVLAAGMGMETPFYCCAILGALLCCASQWWMAAGLVAGATFAIRPDGLAVCAAIVAAAWMLGLSQATGVGLRGRLVRGFSRPLLRIVVGFAIVAVPFGILCLAYYGQILPQTLSAKRLHQLFAGRWWMLLHFWKAPGTPLLVALGLLGIAAVWRRRSSAAAGAGLKFLTLAAALWLAAYVGAWSAVRIDFYPWYLAALAPVGATLAGLTVAWAAVRWRYRFVSGVVLVLLIALGGYWGWGSWRELRRFHVYVRQMVLPRKEIAGLIRTCAEPGRTIGAGAIGLLGYYTPGMRIVDYTGLITPRAALDDPALRPDFFAGNTLGAADAQRYIPVAMYAPAVSAPDAVVWVRRDARAFWSAERCEPAERIDVRFGEAVHLRGASPIRCEAKPGESIQFRLLWRFDRPLPADRSIRYQLVDGTGSAAASIDTHGFFRERRPFTDVEPGEAVLDFVDFPVPRGTPAGFYELSVSVCPSEGYEFAAAGGSRYDANSFVLFSVDID